jgi:enoyl-CoA hydratase
MLNGYEAVALGLADVFVESKDLLSIWNDPIPFGLSSSKSEAHAQSFDKLRTNDRMEHIDLMQKHFAHPSLQAIVQSLQSDDSDWAKTALSKLQKNSPLMLAVTLEQVKRARQMSLADDLRMERDMVYHSFAGTPHKHSDTVEGIRALVVDKDHMPKWQPARIEDVTPAMVNAFFMSPWTAAEHPLKFL